MLAPIGTLLGLIVGDVGIGCGAWSRVTRCSRPCQGVLDVSWVSLHCTLIITAEHEQLYVFVGRVHQSVEVAALEHREVAGAQRPDFERSLALRHLAPVADHHVCTSLKHQEDFLVVAMPVQPDAAFGLKDVQIHVVHGHEWFGRVVVVLRSERIEVPRLKLTLKLTASGIAAVVRYEIPVFQEPDAAMRIWTDASTEKVVPTAQHHVELVVIVAPAFRVPHPLVDVAPRDLDKQRQDRMHRGVGRHLTHVTIVEALPIECAWRAANQIGRGLQLSTRQCVE